MTPAAFSSFGFVASPSPRFYFLSSPPPSVVTVKFLLCSNLMFPLYRFRHLRAPTNHLIDLPSNLLNWRVWDDKIRMKEEKRKRAADDFRTSMAELEEKEVARSMVKIAEDDVAEPKRKTSLKRKLPKKLPTWLYLQHQILLH